MLDPADGLLSCGGGDLPEPADLPEVGEHLAAGHVFQHHVEVRVVLWGKKATLQTKWTEQRLRKKRKMAPTIGWWRWRFGQARSARARPEELISKLPRNRLLNSAICRVRGRAQLVQQRTLRLTRRRAEPLYTFLPPSEFCDALQEWRREDVLPDSRRAMTAQPADQPGSQPPTWLRRKVSSR